MRTAVACTLALSAAASVLTFVWATSGTSNDVPVRASFVQQVQPETAANGDATGRETEASQPQRLRLAQAQPEFRGGASTTCANPNALGVARTVEIDTTGGPGFGFEHFKQHDFLREGEVVLTFDDGPWPVTTQQVLKALADHCVKATFFPIGLHAMYEPAIIKQVAEAGHTVGSHTYCHKDLTQTKGTCSYYGKVVPWEYDPKEEIEKGISAVAMALGPGVQAPFFRFPALRHPPELVKYLGERNIGIFSTDVDSFDFKFRTADKLVPAIMARLKKHGKGILLMHDFQKHTAAAMPELLNQLKANGFKIVHMRPKFAVTTLAQYDEMVRKDQKLPPTSQRPTSSVVRTVE